MTERHFYEQNFETGGQPQERRKGPSGKGGGLLEFLVILVVAFALVFGFVRPFVVEAFYIPSESMVPTLEVGDRVFVNKFIYDFSSPERRDVVVFGSVEGGEEELIKRVVGLPGDVISVSNGDLLVNGEPQNEPYLAPQRDDGAFFAQTTVPEGHVFVMGDNRANSRDSRFFGPVPYENIEGEAFVIFWPPSHVGLFWG